MGWTYADWYQKNKVKISRARRLKYRLDQEHRERMKQTARDGYAKRMMRQPRPDRNVLVGTDRRTFVTIGGLSKRINRSIQTIRGYHRDGFFPDASFSDVRGWRLYSEAQVLLLKKTFQKFDEKKIKSLKEVAKILRLGWEVDK